MRSNILIFNELMISFIYSIENNHSKNDISDVITSTGTVLLTTNNYCTAVIMF